MESRITEDAEIKFIDRELKQIESRLSRLSARKQILLERKEKLRGVIHKRKSEYLASKNWSLKTFSWSDRVDTVLKEVFKMSEFRPFQLEVINATLSKEDVILIMPTGGGKSLCYQLPALIDEGVTLVVSPLVSLMEDQLMALKKINYPAIMLSSYSTKEDSKRATQTLKDSSTEIKLIYVTPEKLARSKRFMNQLQKCHQQGRFSRLAVDEIHCCSAWGHDFRTDYSYLGILKDMFPGVPLLGLTATSTSKVTADVQEMLNIQGCLIMKSTFNRPNLYYEVMLKPPTQDETLGLLEGLLKNKFKKQSGIIYTTTIKECEELTKELRKRDIEAGVYHAMLDTSSRSKMHSKWMLGEYQVIVATIAFGMGIDKPNVRFVIHHTISKSMENFYQESGRAGRDGKNSHCIVMYRLADVFKQSTMVFTQQTGLEKLYNMVNYCLDSKTCRRSLIAEHFDEVWESTCCSKMCDHCKNASIVNEIDVAPHCRSLYRIIDNAMQIEFKLTVIKLVDAWFGKGELKFRIANMKCPLEKTEAENVIAFLLIKGYLKEDFHYTAYSTISYIRKGPKFGCLEDSDHRINMEFYMGTKRKNSYRKSGEIKPVEKNSSRLKRKKESRENVSPKKVKDLK